MPNETVCSTRFSEPTGDVRENPPRRGAAAPHKPAATGRDAPVSRGTSHFAEDAFMGSRRLPLAPDAGIVYHADCRDAKAARHPASSRSGQATNRRETAKRRFGAGFERGNALVRRAPEGASSACFVSKALGRAFCGDIPEARPLPFSPTHQRQQERGMGNNE